MATNRSLRDVAAAAERSGAPRLALAVVIGVLGAAGNVVFQWTIEEATHIFRAIGEPFGRPGIPLALLVGGVVLLALDRLAGGDVLGYGFPRFRGGPMFWADLVGVREIYDTMSRLYDEHGEWLKPAPLLEHLAADQTRFSDYQG